MRSFYASVILLGCFLYTPLTSYTQFQLFDPLQPDHIDFISEYGDQQLLALQFDVNYQYELFLWQVKFHYPLWSQGCWSLHQVVTPQVNLTWFRSVDNIPIVRQGLEFGVNNGFQIQRAIFNMDTYAFFLVSSGPHFVSGTPERQANGFIFSDNFLVGIETRLLNGLYFFSRGGIRHISNLSISKPNGGVNNIVFGIGMSYNPWQNL